MFHTVSMDILWVSVVSLYELIVKCYGTLPRTANWMTILVDKRQMAKLSEDTVSGSSGWQRCPKLKGVWLTLTLKFEDMHFENRKIKHHCVAATPLTTIIQEFQICCGMKKNEEGYLKCSSSVTSHLGNEICIWQVLLDASIVKTRRRRNY